MDDAVGEVLAQRKALERGAGAGVALSVLLHGAITAAAVWGALRQPHEEALRTVEIKFAPMPAPVQAPDGGPKPAAPQPKPQPVEKPAPKPQPVPPPMIETPVKPAAKPAPAKAVPLSPYGKSAKPGAEPQPAPAPAVAAPEIPAGGTGAVVEGDFPYTIYIDRMRTLIGQHWYRPQSAPGISATVSFVINRDGSVREVVAESESGSTAFDLAARRAVLETSPLPPLPFGYSGTFLRVHLTFK